MPDPEDKQPNKDDEVRAHYLVHDDVQNPDVDASIIYRSREDVAKGVGFVGGEFGDTVVIPVTFNWTDKDLGLIDENTLKDIRAGDKSTDDLSLDTHQQSLAFDALQRVAEQSGANIKFVVVDELPENKGIRFGQFFTPAIMSTSVEERANGAHSNLHNGNVYDIDRGEYYSIVANEYRIAGQNDQQNTYCYMHEVCHALGFDHPNSGFNIEHVDWGETVMRTQQGTFDRFISNPPLQLGGIDIEALQQLYGENNGNGGVVVDVRGQSADVVAEALRTSGYDPDMEAAYRERVMNEAGVHAVGTSNPNYMKGTQYNDTFTGAGDDDLFYANGGQDVVTDFHASGNYDWYDYVTGAEEDGIVAPEGAVGATIIKELNDSVLITFEDENGAIPNVSMRLTNFTGDVEDIDVYTQVDGKRGDEIETYHYDERSTATGSIEIAEPGQGIGALSTDDAENSELHNLSSSFTGRALAGFAEHQQSPEIIQGDVSVTNVMKV